MTEQVEYATKWLFKNSLTHCLETRFRSKSVTDLLPANLNDLGLGLNDFVACLKAVKAYAKSNQPPIKQML